MTQRWSNIWQLLEMSQWRQWREARSPIYLNYMSGHHHSLQLLSIGTVARGILFDFVNAGSTYVNLADAWGTRKGLKNAHKLDFPINSLHLGITLQPNAVFAATSFSFRQIRKYVTAAVNSCQISLQLDITSDITITSPTPWITIWRPAYKPTDRVARNATGQQIPFVGGLEVLFP